MTKLSGEILRAIRRSESSSNEIATAIDALGKKPEPIEALATKVMDAITPKRRGRPPKYQTRQLTAEA